MVVYAASTATDADYPHQGPMEHCAPNRHRNPMKESCLDLSLNCYLLHVIEQSWFMGQGLGSVKRLETNFIVMALYK